MDVIGGSGKSDNALEVSISAIGLVSGDTEWDRPRNVRVVVDELIFKISLGLLFQDQLRVVWAAENSQDSRSAPSCWEGRSE